MYDFFKKDSLILISMGAIPGALIRWQIDDIFTVNLIGCFLLGFFNSWTITKRYKLAFRVGLCGSMTTFSGWTFELNNYLTQGLYKLFLVHSVLSVLMAVFAVGIGHVFAKKLNN